MKRFQIRILGAFDRFNYGDLLFPLVLSGILKKIGVEADFTYYGLVKSDLSKFGAVKTFSFRQLMRDTRPDSGSSNLILAGGEILCADYKRLYSYISLSFKILQKSRCFRYLDKRLGIILRYLGLNSKYPLVQSNRFFDGNVQVYYSSVGGTELEILPLAGQKYVIEAISKSTYISVRDNSTFNYLKDRCPIEVYKVPDSALLISDLYDRYFLKQKSTRVSACLHNSQYILFQISRWKARGQIETIIQQLRRLTSSTRLKIVLCPIGRALGHEDRVPLAAIHKGLAGSLFISDADIWEIMYLIANARMFAGTSLHGMITAMSFGVPYCCVDPLDNKLKSYFESWSDHPIDRMTPVSLLAERGERILQLLPSEWKVNEQKECVYSSFRRMISTFI